MTTLPLYADLPGGAAGICFGADDVIGSLNRITPAHIAAATALVRDGLVFSLNAPLDWPDPPLFGRRSPNHYVTRTASGYSDDYLDDFFPQASSQWDGLRHVPAADGGLYNGHDPEDLGIEGWAQRGIVGRGVLLDVGRVLARTGRPLRWNERDAVTVDDLEACVDEQGSVVGLGDILLVRTGWTTGHNAASAAERRAGAARTQFPGLEASERTAAWLWDRGVAAVATDAPALESWPPEETSLHRLLVPGLGMPLGELWLLDEVASYAADSGRYDGLLTSAPLHCRGGVGSPANALLTL